MRVFTLIFTHLALASRLLCQDAAATVNHLAAVPGTQVVMPVAISGFGNVGALTIIIAYNDQVLQYHDVQNTANNALSANAFQIDGEAVVGVVGSWANGINLPDGVLVEFVFDYLGGNSNLEFLVEYCEVVKTNLSSIPITFNNGSLSPGHFWEGLQSSNWQEPENWTMQFFPQQDAKVVIDEAKVTNHFPEINTLVTVESIQITGNAFLTVNSNGSLTTGSITNKSTHESGGLKILSDATGTGSLLHCTDGVQASVQRHLGGCPQSWHLVSSPVGLQNIEQLFYQNGFFAFYEPSGSWVNYLNNNTYPTWADANHGTSHLIAGKGYLAACESSSTKTFFGELNQAEIEFQLSNQAMPNGGFNLLGNPYPSYIDWTAHEGWTGRENLQADAGGYSIWLWNYQAGNFGAFNTASANPRGTLGATAHIAPMEAFFVKAQNHNGIIGMNNQARLHGNQSTKTNEGIQSLVLTLEASNIEYPYQDQVMIEVLRKGNISGTEKMFAPHDQSPSLYLQSEQKAYSIMFIDNIQSVQPISLNFEAGAAALHSIAAQGDHLFDILILEDRQTETFHNLKQNNTYFFNAAPGDTANRFLLHFSETTNTNQTNTVESRLFFANGWLILNSADEATTITIYDTAGKQVQQMQATGQGRHKWNFNTPPGIYLYQIIGLHNSSKGKLIIN